MKCPSLKWNCFDLFRISSFPLKWLSEFNRFLSGMYWKMVFSCPFPPEIAVKWKLWIAVEAKRGSHFGKGEQDLQGDPSRDRVGGRSSQICALAGEVGWLSQPAIDQQWHATSCEHPPWIVLLQVGLFSLFFCILWLNGAKQRLVRLLPGWALFKPFQLGVQCSWLYSPKFVI